MYLLLTLSGELYCLLLDMCTISFCLTKISWHLKIIYDIYPYTSMYFIFQYMQLLFGSCIGYLDLKKIIVIPIIKSLLKVSFLFCCLLNSKDFFCFVGIIWPLEAIPEWLRYISICLPQTYAAEAMRCVLSRGMSFVFLFFNIFL